MRDARQGRCAKQDRVDAGRKTGQVHEARQSKAKHAKARQVGSARELGNARYLCKAPRQGKERKGT